MSNLEKLDRGEAMIAIVGGKYECVDIRLNMEVQKTALLCLAKSANNNKGDWEVIHGEADEVLLSALRSLGMNELVDAYNKLVKNFWCA